MSEVFSETQMLSLIKQHSHWLQTEQDAANKLSVADALLSDITVSAQNLSSAEFVRCQFTNVAFVKCDLSAAIFIESAFNNCRFLGCSLVKADFRSACCNSVDFTGSDLTRADLTDADLRYANLTNCLLNWAWLIQTDLRYAILDRTELKGARLVGTKLYNSKNTTPGTLEQVVIKDIDISPQGNGKSCSGLVAIDRLWGINI